MGAGISGKGRGELSRVLGSGRRFIAPSDVIEVLGVDPDTAAKKLARWAADGWLRRVRRGLYIGVPVDATSPSSWSEDPLLVAAAVWSPCYFTGWTAAHHWTLTEQVFRTTVLKTTGRVRSSSVTMLDQEYHVAHVADEALSWGLRSEWRDGTRLRIADPGRTVVEILDTPALGGGIRHGAEVLAAYLDDNDPTTLIDYADRLGNRAVFKRLGYLVEVLDRDLPEIVGACRERISSGISELDPDGPNSGPRTMRWGLRLNAVVVREGAS
jgi:predicted transcriptional regulator of viral defense system